MTAPRDYQVAALDETRAALRAGKRRVILSGPTGSGKTNMAGEMIRAAVDKGSRVLFVADRRVLVAQTSRRLSDMGIDHGLIMAGSPRRMSANVDVASAQTLEKIPWWNAPEGSRLARPYDLVVVDEAHDRRKLTDLFIVASGCRAVGLTATPFTRGMGLPLKEYPGRPLWEAIVNVRPTNRLIEDGWLVGFEAWCCPEIDMTGAKTVGGEWSRKTVSDRAIPVSGDIIAEWSRHTQRKFGQAVPTIVFSSTVAHGEELQRQFAAVGYQFEQISYRDTDPEERDRKIRAMKEGTITGLISCEALAKGFDETRIQCVVMARPYKKALANVIQQLGRGMRPHEGKSDCLLLDHAGNMMRFADQIEGFWENGWGGLDQNEKKAAAKAPPKERKCNACGFFLPSPIPEACPQCGRVIRRKRKTLAVEGVNLRRYQRPPRARSPWERQQADKYADVIQAVGDPWPHISHLAIQRHPDDHERAQKWARMQYHSLTGDWPQWGRQLEPAARCDKLIQQAVLAEYNAWKKRNSAGWMGTYGSRKRLYRGRGA